MNYVYTYKVQSVQCELYRIDIKYFKTWFFECILLIDKMTKKRKVLVLERIKKIVEMNEYACLKYGESETDKVKSMMREKKKVAEVQESQEIYGVDI